jgi:hypothetical protein
VSGASRLKLQPRGHGSSGVVEGVQAPFPSAEDAAAGVSGRLVQAVPGSEGA